MTMPRSLQYILDHADELAQRAEDFEPTDAQMAIASELADLHRAVLDASDAQLAIAAAVIAARTKGATWEDIGAVVGTTDEAARQRYGKMMPSRGAAAKAPQ
jgi:anthranilate phosphoribosyltransferase